MRYLVSMALVLGLAVIFNSCNKERETTAIIHVLDIDDSPVEGAVVTMYADATDPTQTVRAGFERSSNQETTNNRGKVIFNLTDMYEQGASGLAVLNVYATYFTLNDTDATDTLHYFGDGVIKIVEEQANELDVIIYPK